MLSDDIIRLRGQNYEPLLPEVRRAVPGAGFADPPAPRAAQAPRRTPASHPDIAPAGLSGDRGGADRRRAHHTHREAARLLLRTLNRSRFGNARARLRGALTWRLETDYNELLTAAHVHLNELNAPVEALTRQYGRLRWTRQAASHSYVGYDVQIARLRERVGDGLQRVDMLIARQGHMIETVAITSSRPRRERLVGPADRGALRRCR